VESEWASGGGADGGGSGVAAGGATTGVGGKGSAVCANAEPVRSVVRASEDQRRVRREKDEAVMKKSGQCWSMTVSMTGSLPLIWSPYAFIVAVFPLRVIV
jgi:hypothetical protein